VITGITAAGGGAAGSPFPHSCGFAVVHMAIDDSRSCEVWNSATSFVVIRSYYVTDVQSYHAVTIGRAILVAQFSRYWRQSRLIYIIFVDRLWSGIPRAGVSMLRSWPKQLVNPVMHA
jgi:hypothetical protein